MLIQTSLESSNGEAVTIECYIIPTDSPRKWILVTALANQVAIGFVDGIFYGEHGTSKVEAPHTMRVNDPTFAHKEIRYESGDDGLFVKSSERQKKIGTTLMATIRQIFIGLGAKMMLVNQVKESAEGFYQKLGMQPTMGGFQENFDNNDIE